jgi:hypothetical protein
MDELYCGWCGKPTLDFEANFENGEPLLYADELLEKSDSILIIISIINTGINSITIEKKSEKVN